MKAIELRQSILQAAVQGRLVPQDIHDEPASELLKRIRTEKAKLIKEGKIKKEKPLPPVAEDDVPYDLPDGWVWCRVGAVSTVRGGKRIPKGMDFSRVSTPHIYIRVTDMKNHTIVDNNLKFIDDKVFEQIKQYTISADDLYITIAGTIGSCGIVPKEFDNMNLTENAAKLCNISLVNKHYLVYCISSQIVQDQFTELTNQMAQPKLALFRIASTIFPLPPLAEQQRIIAKVDELMALCDEFEAAEKEQDALENRLTEYLPKSILQAAVQGKLVPQDIHDEPASELLKRIRAEKAKLIKEGKIKKDKPLPPIAEDDVSYDLPDGWVWCRLGEVCLVNPRNNLPDNLDVTFTPMPLIPKEYSVTHGQEYSLWGKVKSGFTHYAENDVVVAKITPCFQNGKSCIMCNLKNGFGAGTTELHVLRTIEVLNAYVLIYVKHPSFLLDGEKNMTGTAGQQRVPTEYLKNCLFPLPPVAEQQRIVAKVDELMAMCEELRAAYTAPVKEITPFKILPFPNIAAETDEEPLLMAAQGNPSQKQSPELKKAIADLFGDDEDE